MVINNPLASGSSAKDSTSARPGHSTIGTHIGPGAVGVAFVIPE